MVFLCFCACIFILLYLYLTASESAKMKICFSVVFILILFADPNLYCFSVPYLYFLFVTRVLSYFALIHIINFRQIFLLVGPYTVAVNVSYSRSTASVVCVAVTMGVGMKWRCAVVVLRSNQRVVH